MKKQVAHWMVLIVIFAAASAMASTILPLNVDTSISEFYPTEALDTVVLELRSRNIPGSLRHRLSVCSFDLSSVSNAISGAVFTVDVVAADSDSFAIDLFGVVDGADQVWDTTLTYNSAHWLTAPNGNVDRDHDAAKVVSLDQWQLRCCEYGGVEWRVRHGYQPDSNRRRKQAVPAVDHQVQLGPS